MCRYSRLCLSNNGSWESEIERLTVQQFREAFHLAPPEGETKQALAAAGVKLPPGGQRPDELWTYVVLVLLSVLVGEVFLANRTTG